MKDLKQLRKFDLKISSNNLYFSRVKDLHRRKIDMDVFLPSKGVNLQRDKVWDLQQKRELIVSIFIERPIPNMCIMSIIDDNDTSPGVGGSDIIQVIDGKQRLSTIIDFYNNEFTVELEGKEFLFEELPEDYQKAVAHYEIICSIVYDKFEKRISDEEKIEWFRRINFFGTPQELSHLEKITK